MSSSDESKSENGKGKAGKSENLSEVHSANCWEKADLGDDERRQKFLRLMGASKKEHHGRFIIGEKDKIGTEARDKAKTEELNKDLENQYVYSNEHKITRYNHSGLGFSSDAPREVTQETREEWKKEAAKKESDNTTQDTKDSKPAAKSGSSSSDDKAKGDKADNAKGDKSDGERKRESSEPTKAEQGLPKKPRMMAFVKASDSS